MFHWIKTTEAGNRWGKGRQWLTWLIEGDNVLACNKIQWLIQVCAIQWKQARLWMHLLNRSDKWGSRWDVYVAINIESSIHTSK